MKNDCMVIVIILTGLFVLSSSAFAVSLSISSDAGGFTEEINVGKDDSVNGYTLIAPEGISNSIEGSGSLKERHRVSNTAGAFASVGVDVREAESYSYSYSLTPGRGYFWPAKKYPEVSAGESLDVVNADYIKAYASAHNARGMFAEVSTVLSDPEGKACLAGYSNSATASSQDVSAIQSAESASAPEGLIQTKAGANSIQLSYSPLKLTLKNAIAGTTIKNGSITGYSDQANASCYELAASQSIDDASGEWIKTQSKSDLWLISFSGLKRSIADVSTKLAGNLTGYEGMAGNSNDQVLAQQSGHIEGTLSSTATNGIASKTRSSNYGMEYDFDMLARRDASGSSASGTLGYYVDINHPGADRIQGAVDASQSGDTINVAGGTYYENVQIDKSLSIKGDVGSGPSTETVVDGQKSGSVFTIGKDDPNVEVSLRGIIILNGSGTYTERWPGEPLVQCGGGIWNAGTVNIVSSLISGNTASGYGSGIWSTGNLSVDSTYVEGNGKPLDGGGIWNSGNLMVTSSIITGNEAYWNGGGIWNSGNMLVENSYVGGNAAGIFGGGIANDKGQAIVKDSTISANNAAGGGGGVYNIMGAVSLEVSNLSWNSGNNGGGILNNGEMTVSGGYISNNNAANGGGIWNMGTMNLKTGSIDHNTAQWGGGIENYGIINMDGGSIDHNSAFDAGGIDNSGVINLNGGSVHDNVANAGGGILNSGASSCILNLNGGSIDNNTANYGGGIYNGFFGIVTLNGSSIEKNTANYEGGGIYNFGVVELINGSIAYNRAIYTPYYSGGGIEDKGTVLGDWSLVHDNNPPP